MEPIQLSQDAYDRLRAEHEERTGPRRKEITARIEEAREHGDLRENAEYHAAKNEQGLNEARIRQLDQMLRDATIVEVDASGETVEPGVVVEIRINDDPETQTYLFGSIEERHETYDVLSTASPLGHALLGASPGSTVTYQGPRREMSVTVVAVRTP